MPPACGFAGHRRRAAPADAAAATVGEETIRVGDVQRALPRATGGKPIDPAALATLQAQTLEEADPAAVGHGLRPANRPGQPKRSSTPPGATFGPALLSASLAGGISARASRSAKRTCAGSWSGAWFGRSAGRSTSRRRGARRISRRIAASSTAACCRQPHPPPPRGWHWLCQCCAVNWPAAHSTGKASGTDSALAEPVAPGRR